MMISPHQIKAARAMLDWSQDMLAHEAGVSPATIYNLEKGQQSYSSGKKIRVALERKGFEFIGTGGLIPATTGAEAIANFICGLVRDHQQNKSLLQTAIEALEAITNEGLNLNTEQIADHALTSIKAKII